MDEKSESEEEDTQNSEHSCNDGDANVPAPKRNRFTDVDLDNPPDDHSDDEGDLSSDWGLREPRRRGVQMESPRIHPRDYSPSPFKTPSAGKHLNPETQTPRGSPGRQQGRRQPATPPASPASSVETLPSPNLLRGKGMLSRKPVGAPPPKTPERSPSPASRSPSPSPSPQQRSPTQSPQQSPPAALTSSPSPSPQRRLPTRSPQQPPPAPGTPSPMPSPQGRLPTESPQQPPPAPRRTSPRPSSSRQQQSPYIPSPAEVIADLKEVSIIVIAITWMPFKRAFIFLVGGGITMYYDHNNK